MTLTPFIIETLIKHTKTHMDELKSLWNLGVNMKQETRGVQRDGFKTFPHITIKFSNTYFVYIIIQNSNYIKINL